MPNDAQGQPIKKGDFLFDIQNGGFVVVTGLKIVTIPSQTDGKATINPTRFIAAYVQPIENDPSQGVYFNHPSAFIHISQDFIAQQKQTIHNQLKLIEKVAILSGMDMGEKVVRVDFAPVQKKTNNKK